MSEQVPASYQTRVGAWMDDVFSAGGADLRTRIDRFLEEAFEQAQSLDYDPARIVAIRDYVFSRPIGEPRQETGGVMVTLASLCHAAGIDMMAEGERELARVHTPEVRAKIMAKQASKNALHTPLPTAEAAALASGRPIAASPAMYEALKRVRDQLGEAVHTAFRQASDDPQAHKAWMAIKALPGDEWSAVLAFVLEGLGVEAALASADGEAR